MTTTPADNEFEHVVLDRRGRYAVITLNRPRVLNALSSEVIGELSRAVAMVAASPDLRALIVTGTGKAFAAGADIGELQRMESAAQGYQYSRACHDMHRQLQELDRPVIMAVNGYALGGGCELAMAGDIILASESARFGQPEVNLGLIPGFGGTQRLPRLVGRTRALELILGGEQIDAREAFRLGLVNRVLAPEHLLPEAEAMAEALAGKAPLAVALAKRAVYEGLDMTLWGGNETESSYFGLAVGSEDRREGTEAFLEKRAADWKGR